MQHNVVKAEAYLRSKRHLDPSSRLATIDMGRKFGDCAPFRGAGSPSSTMSLGPRSTTIPSGILMHQATSRLATIRMRRKLGGYANGGAGSPSNTMWPGTRPTSVPSGILMHPAV